MSLLFRKIGLALLLMPPVGAAQTNQVEGIDAGLTALRKSCDTLAENPRDAEALAVLTAYAGSTNAIDRLRSRAMAAYALTGLMQSDTNLYVTARESHARAYPADKHLLRIAPQECYVACAVCAGEGFVMGPCPVCKGDTRCPECKGRGVLPEQKTLKGSRSNTRGLKCSACSGSGRIVCRRCGGKNLAAMRCPECRGNPLEFKTPPKVVEDFALLVQGISKWIANEDIFFRQFAAAKTLSDPAKRIASLKSLIASYGYRAEKEEMERLLAADQAAVNASVELKQQDELSRMRDLITLRDLQQSADPAAAAATIRDYLTKNPETENRIELQRMMNALELKAARNARKRKYLYLAGGALAILFGLGCFRFRRRPCSHMTDSE
jgi:hypothetical protein